MADEELINNLDSDQDSFLDLLHTMNDASDLLPEDYESKRPPPDPSLLPRRKLDTKNDHPPRKHNRSVSWGRNATEPILTNDEDDDDDVKMPSLHESFGDILASHEEMLKAINPFEEEAQKALLKAIDSRHRAQKSMDVPSTILPHVPDDRFHNFEDGLSLSADTATPVEHMSPSSADDAWMDDDNNNGDNNDGDDAAGSFSQGPSLSSKQRQPLLQLRNPVSSRPRGLSVEQTLFDLTNAISAVHGNESIDRTVRHNRHPSTSSVPLVSVAEGMAQTAVLLSDIHHEHGHELGQGGWGDNLGALSEEIVDSSDDAVANMNSDHANNSDDIEAGGCPPRNKRKERRKGLMQSAHNVFHNDWVMWTEFFRPRQAQLLSYLKVVTLYVLLPVIAVALILFYFAGNPPTGEKNSSGKASASWILLFCSRQIITFCIAMCTQAFIIDFVALQTLFLLKTMGPVMTLLIVQSKGWPHIMFWWGIFDFALLHGDRVFAHHWLYYQDVVRVFTESNPSGNVVNNRWYSSALAIAVSVSVVVALKRFLVGLYLGRQTFSNYGQMLAQVMEKMLYISEVAGLAKEIEIYALNHDRPILRAEHSALRGMIFVDEDDDDVKSTVGSTARSVAASDMVIDPSKRDLLTGSLHYSQKLKLMQLLDAWEEPVRHDNAANNEIASISAVLRFRKALTFIQRRYPFSSNFGKADTRESCIESAQEVYQHLLKGSLDRDVLHFETIARLAVLQESSIDQLKAKALIKLFRPGREGELTMLDFVKSIDAVYKEFRMLSATIENSSQIDRAFERMFNAVFYFVLVMIILSQLGFDPLALFLSLSSVILAFAFAIGSSASRYLEGVLFVLGRRPYGIGDYISIAEPGTFQSLDGALPWSVENVTLFETVLVYLPTNERASLSNGSLASKMITNWARSPQAQFHIFLKFPLNAPYEKIVLFKQAIEEYMKARPREWRALNGFRANRIMTEENYLELIIVIQHRDAWQNVGQVLDSKANLSSYCQEVMRQLELHYEAPRLPVDLTYATASKKAPGDDNAMDGEALTRAFQTAARNKHNITVC